MSVAKGGNHMEASCWHGEAGQQEWGGGGHQLLMSPRAFRPTDELCDRQGRRAAPTALPRVQPLKLHSRLTGEGAGRGGGLQRQLLSFSLGTRLDPFERRR